MEGAGRFWGSLTNAEASRAWLGAIAQLGERVLCKHEVVGSIPSGSTIFCWCWRLRVAEPAASTARSIRVLKRHQFRSEPSSSVKH